MHPEFSAYFSFTMDSTICHLLKERPSRTINLVPEIKYQNYVFLTLQFFSFIFIFLNFILFNFYTEYIMLDAGLDEAQAGIKIAMRNINNLRYADDTTLMAESEEELKSLNISERGE